MSLDIWIRNEATGQELDMNWLRNPFGLCNWAEDTYLYETKQESVSEEQSLWYVINHWSYGYSEQVDKPLFLEVVQKYGEVILNAKKGFFWFPLDKFPDNLSYHVKPHHAMEISNLLGTGDVEYYGKQIGASMEQVAKFVDLGHLNGLEGYKDWYRQLIEFAEVLQHPDSKFYCSN